MAGITLEQAEAKLTAYLAAEEKILLGQEVWMEGDKLSRADLAAVQKGVQLWEGRCQRLSRTGLKIREVIPR